jgi:hypothetical protein
MLVLGKYSKVLITIISTFTIFWVGGMISSSIIGYNIFIPGSKLILKPEYSETMLLHDVNLYANLSFYKIASFYVTFFCMILLCIHWRKYLKSKGWLFMTFALFFLASIIEIVTSYYDIRLLMDFRSNFIHHFTDFQITDYFMFKLKKLSVASGLEFLSIISIMLYIIWKPLNNNVIKS